MQAYCGRRERDGGGKERSYNQNKMARNVKKEEEHLTKKEEI